MTADTILASLHLSTPEIILAVGGLVLLMIGVFSGERSGTIVTGLAVALLIISGLWLVLATGEGEAYGGAFVSDAFGKFMKVLALIGSVTAMVMTVGHDRSEQLDRFEFPVLIVLSTLGMLLMISANSLLSLYLALELQSLALYVLAAINRDSLRSTEAGLKYFVLGALSSGMLLYGMSMVYGATGTLALAQLHGAVVHAGMSNLMVFGLIFMIVGISFKLGVAPFHMWIPDVYQGAPTPITTFIASASKLAAFGMAYRLLAHGMAEVAAQWQLMLAVLAVLSLAIGNLVAIVQTNLKRMLAYSTISHMGYLLLGLSAANPEGYSAAMFYAISYALMSTASFGVILALSRAGFECEEIDDLRGLNQRAPWLAFLMMLVMVSLAGVPPMFGFFAKLLVLQAAIHANMLWLAIVGAVFAIIGLYYYLRVVKVMYFDKPVEGSELAIQPDGSLRVVLSLNALALLVIGLWWGPLIGWCRAAMGG